MAGSEAFRHFFSPVLYQSCSCLQVKSQFHRLNFQCDEMIPDLISLCRGGQTWQRPHYRTDARCEGQISYPDFVGETGRRWIRLMFPVCWQESFRCRSSHSAVTQSMKTHRKKYGSHLPAASCLLSTRSSFPKKNWTSRLLPGSRCFSDVYGPAQIHRVQRRIPVVSERPWESADSTLFMDLIDLYLTFVLWSLHS